MWSLASKRLKIWGVRIGLLALILQSLAGAMMMPAGGTAPLDDLVKELGWIEASICQAGDDEPAGADPVCPVCFVLCHSAGLVPPAAAVIALSTAPTHDVPTGDHAPGPASVRPLSARGPPELA